ncbi:F-box protein At5g03970 [Gastrolobium bilobum]|uniref:F-box protein At5g03970 n=1 Tax=Gastrolobium bilobum TaxID=150636 RepID=UPI002AB0EC7C|nr:F-box protein At5g03970 [Gastrolobium bilobum]XP_061340452.1 F-box protein At5g03970 [Gastrolobium bilobum]XP_061340453.1 F-box protein At5g03970 [Gastrolobium bilobum]
MERRNRNSVYAVLNCDDILHEILLRLPPSTISKLVIVSKRWLRLICSSSFRRCYLNQWGQNFRLLGFFVCNFLYLGRPRDGYRRPRSEPALPFLSTCKEGDDLKLSGILKQLGYFMDCSNGIILSGLHPKTYYVYNTMTKQRYQLPEPQRFYKTLCMALIVEEYLDRDISYKVIRARCECKLKERNTVSIETFSSRTGKWKQTTLMCSTSFALRPRTVGMVVGGVVHWFAMWGKLVIYDPRLGDRHVALVKLPAGVITHEHEESVLGESSDGLLLYGQSNNLGLEIWILEKEAGANPSTHCNCTHLRYQWILRWRLNFKAIWKQLPSLNMHSKETQILSFLPQNSTSVFFRSGWNIFLYDLETKTVEIVNYQGRGASISWESSKIVPYFQPDWPLSFSVS